MLPAAGARELECASARFFAIVGNKAGCGMPVLRGALSVASAGGGWRQSGGGEMKGARVVSGMRPTGALHLGHWCGVLWNWQALQRDNECFFFVADWHALTTDYASPPPPDAAREMVLAWLSAGIDPSRAVMFAQSDVPAHAELYVLLAMLCPLPWLLRMPTYKEQKDNLNRDLDTHGFLGYPLLQAADILAYCADAVPVGEDQLPHLEFAREVARRFNHLYGRSDAFSTKAGNALNSLDKSAREQLEKNARRYLRDGDSDAFDKAAEVINNAAKSDRAILRGWAFYGAEEILPAPQAALTKAPKLPGTDGRKMSKSYDNAINLFDAPEQVNKKLARMQTDPARKRRNDPGDPAKCPVADLHNIFTAPESRDVIFANCRTASIGCVECKREVGNAINEQLAPVIDARRMHDKPGIVEEVLQAGATKAKAEADNTLRIVRAAMKLKAQ